MSSFSNLCSRVSNGLFLLVLICVPIFLMPSAQALTREQEISNSLSNFRNYPYQTMSQLSIKKDRWGRVLPVWYSLFEKRDIIDGTYIRIKARLPVFKPQPRAPIEPGDLPQSIPDLYELETLEQIESAGLLQASLSENPWSGDYWSLALGSTAKRYLDPHYPMSSLWEPNANYLNSTASQVGVEFLSPAEKYDLLVGDENHSLQKRELAEGQYYFSRNGKVESWMGICHGWAPASFMVSRPKKAIQVLSADGKTMIPFTPDDIKALVTLLWAKAPFETRWTGHRCDKVNPTRNAIGRVNDPECFDNNPATWHLVVANQIGLSKRSFIFDASFDHQVWNQPVTGYRYSYFNPQTNLPVASLAEARISRSSFTADKFKDFRAQQTEWLVGIAMDVEYLGETAPSARAIDGPENDLILNTRYLYDLELDRSGNVIGGEWYSSVHPDFLWTPPKGAVAMSRQDYAMMTSSPPISWKSWLPAANGSLVPQPIPAAMRPYAIRASREGVPLSSILAELLRKSTE